MLIILIPVTVTSRDITLSIPGKGLKYISPKNLFVFSVRQELTPIVEQFQQQQNGHQKIHDIKYEVNIIKQVLQIIESLIQANLFLK